MLHYWEANYTNSSIYKELPQCHLNRMVQNYSTVVISIALSLGPPSFVLLYMHQLVQVTKSCVDAWNANNAQSQLKFSPSP